MASASFQFIVFGLIASVLSNLHSSRIWRSIVLLTTSMVFLVTLEHSLLLLLPLFGFLLLGYGGLVLIGRGWSRSKVWMIFVVIFTYIWLKQYAFLPKGILLHFPYLSLGLSYIFFRVLHLLIEFEDSKPIRDIGPISYLMYTLNLTTFLSGPIQRYDEFAADQLSEKPIALDPSVASLQLERIVRGFFKVNVLATILHMVYQNALSQLMEPLPPEVRIFSAIRLCIVYPLFLYSNFSGYIDIVIAIARLMRVRLPENFDRPFSAASYLDFWNRWHITLSTWLKTYAYNPLLVMLMRRFSSPPLQPFLAVFCFFVTFSLTGIWHGRTSEFVLFGILQGAGVAINKLWQLGLAETMGRKGYKALASHPVYVVLSRGLTFSWFAFAAFWFWASWRELHTVFDALRVSQWIVVCLATWLLSAVVLAAWEWLRFTLLSVAVTGRSVLTSGYARVVFASALALSAYLASALLDQAAPDLIYKAF
jgi:alginate O-acetyltransferase complex protein AlgI